MSDTTTNSFLTTIADEFEYEAKKALDSTIANKIKEFATELLAEYNGVKIVVTVAYEVEQRVFNFGEELAREFHKEGFDYRIQMWEIRDPTTNYGRGFRFDFYFNTNETTEDCIHFNLV